MGFGWRRLVQEALEVLPCVTVEPGSAPRELSLDEARALVASCLDDDDGALRRRLDEASHPLWVLDESAPLAPMVAVAMADALAERRKPGAPMDVLSPVPLPDPWRTALAPHLEAGRIVRRDRGEFRDHVWTGGAFHHPLTRARVALCLPEAILQAETLVLTGRVTHDPLLHWRGGYGTLLHRWLAPASLRDLLHPAWTHHPGFRAACHDDHALQRLLLAMGRTLPETLALLEVPDGPRWGVVGGDAFAPVLQAVHDGRWQRWRESDLHDGAVVHVVCRDEHATEAAMDALLLLCSQADPPVSTGAPVLLVIRTVGSDEVSPVPLQAPLTSEAALRLREALVARVLGRRLIGVVGPASLAVRWPGPVSAFDEIGKGLSWLQATADRHAAGDCDLLLTRGLHLALPRHRRGRLAQLRISQ